MHAEIERIIRERKATGAKTTYLVFGYRAAARFHDFLMDDQDMAPDTNIEDSCFMGHKIEVNHKINPNEVRAV